MLFDISYAITVSLTVEIIRLSGDDYIIFCNSISVDPPVALFPSIHFENLATTAP